MSKQSSPWTLLRTASGRACGGGLGSRWPTRADFVGGRPYPLLQTRSGGSTGGAEGSTEPLCEHHFQLLGNDLRWFCYFFFFKFCWWSTCETNQAKWFIAKPCLMLPGHQFCYRATCFAINSLHFRFDVKTL